MKRFDLQVTVESNGTWTINTFDERGLRPVPLATNPRPMKHQANVAHYIAVALERILRAE